MFARRNDIAFVVEDQLIVMCEHQSTVNPNMPLRLLRYVCDTLYPRFVNKDTLYSKYLTGIPAPKFAVLYNGTDKLNNNVLKLSDSFRVKDQAMLELIVNLYDVNHGSRPVHKGRNTRRIP